MRLYRPRKEILDGTSKFPEALVLIVPHDHNPELTMKLPPDVEFHEDIRLLIYRPHGSMNEEAVNKIVSVIGDLEAKLQEPFNRFLDTLSHDEVELNFRYVIHVSLHRRLSYTGRPPVKSAILATDSTAIHYARPACRADSRFSHQCPRLPKTRRSCAMARCSDRTAGCGSRRSRT
jgi:hypothetical protein